MSRDTLTPEQRDAFRQAYEFASSPDGLLGTLGMLGLAVVPVGEPGSVASAPHPADALHEAINACPSGKQYVSKRVAGGAWSLLERSGWRLVPVGDDGLALAELRNAVRGLASDANAVSEALSAIEDNRVDEALQILLNAEEAVVASLGDGGGDRQVSPNIAKHLAMGSASSLEGDGLAKLRAWAESEVSEGSEGDWTYVPWDDLNGSPGLRSMLDGLASASPGEAEEPSLDEMIGRLKAAGARIDEDGLWWAADDHRLGHTEAAFALITAPVPGEAPEGERVLLMRNPDDGLWWETPDQYRLSVVSNGTQWETRWATLDPAHPKEDR